MKIVALLRNWWGSARPAERGRAAVAVLVLVVGGTVAVVSAGSHSASLRPALAPASPGVAPLADVTPGVAGAAGSSEPVGKRDPGLKALGGGVHFPLRVHTRDAAVRKDRHHRHARSTSPDAVGSSPRPTTVGTKESGRGKRSPAAHRPNGPAIVLGASVQDPGAVTTFFRQYDVDAGAADPIGQIRAVADWINANGGVRGRPIEVRVREYSLYGRPTSRDDEGTCAEWRSGKRPLAAVDTHTSVDVLIPCLAREGIASVVSASATPTRADFTSYPQLLYAPGGPALDRAQVAYVDGLREARFFTGGRIGLLTATGRPQLSRAKDALGAALRQAGISPVAEANISLEDPASFFASESDALLRFRLRHVDRVVALDENGLAIGQFMRGAHSQGYHPLYGLGSVSTPAFLARSAPQDELRGAIGVGWSPPLDVAAADAPPNAAATRCQSIFDAAGISAGGRTPFGQFAAYGACDSLITLRDALQRSGRLTLAGLRDGMESLAARQDAVDLGTELDSSHHDGADAWRLLRYASSCSCFRYDGPSHTF